jgi:hypothetical protein
LRIRTQFDNDVDIRPIDLAGLGKIKALRRIDGDLRGFIDGDLRGFVRY